MALVPLKVLPASALLKVFLPMVPLEMLAALVTLKVLTAPPQEETAEEKKVNFTPLHGRMRGRRRGGGGGGGGGGGT